MKQQPYAPYIATILNALVVLEVKNEEHKKYAMQMRERIKRIYLGKQRGEFAETITRLNNILEELNYYCGEYSELQSVLPFLQISTTTAQKPQ